MNQIHDDVELGEGVVVHAFASVLRGARIGAGTSIGSCAVVDGAVVGRNCRIGHGAQVHPGVVLGDDVFVGPGAVICNDLWPRVHKQGWRWPERPVVVVGDGASIGANATILPGVTVGAAALIAAGAVVTKDVSCSQVWVNGHHRSGVAGSRMRYAGESRAR